MEYFRDAARAAFIRQTVGDDEFIHVFGEIDLATEDSFRAAIAESARTARRVIVDLTRCIYIGSQGFAVLSDGRKLTNLGVIAPPRVKRLLDLLGLSGLLTDARPSRAGLSRLEAEDA